MKKDYKNYLELKYGKYGKGLISQKPILKIDEMEWREFFDDWNNWSLKERQEYLYFISSNIEDGHYIRWFLGLVIVVSFLIGFYWGR